jgi:hypothetical protein
MATRPNMGGPSGLPLHLIAQAIPKLTRHDLVALTERLIDRLDELEPDPDIEPNGDEMDCTAAEDDFYPHSNWRGEPGCPISDPGGVAEGEDDEEPDQSATLN